MTFELSDIRGTVYLRDKSPEFHAKLHEVATRLNIVPDFLSAVIAFESGYDANAVNKKTKARGLIQWMPSLAPAGLAESSDIEQLEHVHDWFHRQQKNGKQFNTLADVYAGVFAPLYVSAPQNAVFYASPSNEYEMNSVLDTNKDGTITKSEAAEFPRKMLVSAQKRPKIKGSEKTVETGLDLPFFVGAAVIAVLWFPKIG